MHQKTDLQDGPIFILASERSGTNLLRRRLSEWQNVAYGPAPLHFLKHMYYAQPFYGDFSSKTVLTKFLEDAIGLAYNHFSPWQIRLTPEDIINWHYEEWDQEITAVSVMHAMYTIHAREKGYKTYICKDNNIFDYCYSIATEIPSSRFIYLFRDPRDVVASQLNRPAQNRSTAKMAMLWRDEQIKSIQAIKSPILKYNNVVSISYETFVTNEDKSLKYLCNELEIKHLSSNRDKKAYKEEKTDIKEWKNLTRPTTTKSLGRFKTQLKPKQIKLIECIAWHQMGYLGYSSESLQRPVVKRLHIEKDKLSGTIQSLIARRLNRKFITAGQKERQKYTAEIKSNIYL